MVPGKKTKKKTKTWGKKNPKTILHPLENPSLSERPDPPPEPPAEMPQDDELDSMAGTGHGLPSWTWGCHILVENMMKHWILKGLSVLFGAKKPGTRI